MMVITRLAPDPAVEARHLLAEWKTWLERHRYAPTTVEGYFRIVANLLEVYPQVPVEQFTAEHIERHLDARGFSNSTYVTQLDSLRSFFHWLRRTKRLIRANPCSGVDKPPINRHARRTVMPDQFDHLCKATRRLDQLVALHLMYFSGLRINELRHVKVGDVDLERRLLRVTQGKGSQRSGPRERWTVLHQGTIPFLKLWLWRSVRLHPNLYVVGRRGGGRRPITEQSIRAWFDRSVVRAHLPDDITPHTLRHGFLKLLKLRGVSLEVAANLAGHTDVETTRKIYGALTPEEMLGIYERAMTTKEGVS